MAKYQCRVCKYIFDEEKEGMKIADIDACFMCGSSVDNFEMIEDDEGNPVTGGQPAAAAPEEKAESELAYDGAFVRHDDSCRYMDQIHDIAVSGETLHAAMSTQMPMPNWDEILLLGAQLNPPPLDDDAPVNIQTIIGKKAAKPMVLESPIYISH
ncbi:MAG: FMN-binding glutamate synthase family protein, partial [Emergencia timonensis]